ncbi:hypothetical protein [Bartonella sp. CB175]|uniref:hypothetical protein n=1 Tax=Bartonella sp. CB175 TaxID=3112256 RepID=UPI00300DEAC1
MPKALYIPDETVRKLADEVKKQFHFKSYREAAEVAFRKLLDEKKEQETPAQIVARLQNCTKEFLSDDYRLLSEAEKKQFFDDLSGGI